MAKAGHVAALAAVVLCACAGTEQPIFESLVGTADPPPDVRPPVVRVDAGPPMMGPMTQPPPIIPPPPDDEDGGVRADPSLDPNARFPWAESLPGAGTCWSGRYAGAFECIMPGAVTGWPVQVTGEIAFTLEGSVEQQKLVIEDGSLGGSFFSADTIAGELDCTTDVFRALSTDGEVESFLFPGAFETYLIGTFDDQLLSIEGSFVMLNDEGEQCEGMFTVWALPW